MSLKAKGILLLVLYLVYVAGVAGTLANFFMWGALPAIIILAFGYYFTKEDGKLMSPDPDIKRSHDSFDFSCEQLLVFHSRLTVLKLQRIAKSAGINLTSDQSTELACLVSGLFWLAFKESKFHDSDPKIAQKVDDEMANLFGDDITRIDKARWKADGTKLDAPFAITIHFLKFLTTKLGIKNEDLLNRLGEQIEVTLQVAILDFICDFKEELSCLNPLSVVKRHQVELTALSLKLQPLSWDKMNKMTLAVVADTLFDRLMASSVECFFLFALLHRDQTDTGTTPEQRKNLKRILDAIFVQWAYCEVRDQSNEDVGARFRTKLLEKYLATEGVLLDETLNFFSQNFSDPFYGYLDLIDAGRALCLKELDIDHSNQNPNYQSINTFVFSLFREQFRLHKALLSGMKRNPLVILELQDKRAA